MPGRAAPALPDSEGAGAGITGRAEVAGPARRIPPLPRPLRAPPVDDHGRSVRSAHGRRPRAAGAPGWERTAPAGVGLIVNPRSRPIRSAITVTGIVGACFSSSRTAGSTVSTAEPFNGRRYFGGWSEDSARDTVPREILGCRATAGPRTLRPVQPANPGPVLHADHPLFLLTSKH